MNQYDWIVVGAGLVGTAVSYELVKQGFSVLLLDQDSNNSATGFSYGGIPFWSGMSTLTRSLYHEGMERYQGLSLELDLDFQFRLLNLLLTIDLDDNLEEVVNSFSACAIRPQLITIDEAIVLEPLLNPNGIQAAMTVRHGHVNPSALLLAYLSGFGRLGGVKEIGTVSKIGSGEVETKTGDRYGGGQVLVCTGGWTRTLLRKANVSLGIYFSHAELIETTRVNFNLNSLVMSAKMSRVIAESNSTSFGLVSRWDLPDQEVSPFVLEPGAIQFLDGTIRIGQISRFFSSLDYPVNPLESEQLIRRAIAQVLPSLADLPGSWYRCVVAFSQDHLPVIQAIPNLNRVYVFSGLSSPFAMVPSLAVRFAKWVANGDPIIQALVDRGGSSS